MGEYKILLNWRDLGRKGKQRIHGRQVLCSHLTFRCWLTNLKNTSRLHECNRIRARSKHAERFSLHLTVLFNKILLTQKLLLPTLRWRWFGDHVARTAHPRPLPVIIFKPWHCSKMFQSQPNVLIAITVSVPWHKLSIISSSRCSPSGSTAFLIANPQKYNLQGVLSWHKEYMGSFFSFQ